MPNQKISQLSDGNAAQAADEFLIARSGDNYRVAGTDVAAAATAVGTLTGLHVSGSIGVGTAPTSNKLEVIGRTLVNSNVPDDTGVYLANSSTTGFGLRLDGGGTGKYVASIRNQATTEIMRVNPNGSVGIGLSSPDYALDVTGAVGFAPGASVTPVKNGDVVIEATNNTTLTFKLKGSDGVVRSATLTLT